VFAAAVGKIDIINETLRLGQEYDTEFYLISQSNKSLNGTEELRLATL
jgi:hypothetical protein